jgi:hypothetical protein
VVTATGDNTYTAQASIEGTGFNITQSSAASTGETAVAQPPQATEPEAPSQVEPPSQPTPSQSGDNSAATGDEANIGGSNKPGTISGQPTESESGLAGQPVTGTIDTGGNAAPKTGETTIVNNQ